MDAKRYLDHLAGLLRTHPPLPRIVDGRLALGYAAPLVSLVLGQTPQPLEVPPAGMEVADSFGHRRPAYHGLLLHAWARAISRGWKPAQAPRLADWYAALDDRFVADLSESPIPAARGFGLCGQAWDALALYSGGVALGRADWRQRGEAFFAALRQRVEPRTFMRVGADDNLEPWWYHELVLLHAATSYALAHHDEAWLAFIHAAARRHYDETQPDHASTQPWGINAFLITPGTTFLADQMIHSAITQGEGRPESVAAILFADTLDGTGC